MSRCDFILTPTLQPLLLWFQSFNVVTCGAIDYFISCVTSDFIGYAIKLFFVILYSKCGCVDCLTLLHSNVFVDIFYLNEDLLVLNYTADFNKIFPINVLVY